ncbi:flagellar basal body-associated FliL family protein [Caldimonas tepidiphila]|uniref:flagellar basal body-associated FliL family protein n=1 Tax=Caldimonas tepidiphila TaxID=2315841 RepID=UPI000E5C25A6|nr:flagellar basal body-associated FliL family protein [Caldimonas tepidiphila]
MSAAAAPQAAPSKGSKKLIIIGAVVALLVAIGVGAFMLLAPSADPEEAEATGAAAPRSSKSGPPVFLPLDSFTVNLADRNAERYAQVGITLQLDDEKIAEQLKAYMPAIRNNVLMILSHKTAEDLLSREGKAKLAAEIARESVRPMGIEIDPEDEAEAADDEAPRKKKRRRAAPHNPVQQVHFSNFIVQ